ncbi:hypothetical protein [Hymenobacter sediminicola]|uniref:Uncharacterized protein n=1 Tax=Hymenobacter sediminicola TaxID=2761579 RepID=A0A7G7WBH6_9BACT|nr:hypothetical protein [Hymenobacter sediminicola]QNH63719.1 hypothetical protein H4317_07975 [Hymenobacter sediminicola]
MKETELSRVVFYSKEDMSSGSHLRNGETILKQPINYDENNINNILELYNIHKYIHGGMYLTSWTHEAIHLYKTKSQEYRKITHKFMSNIDDSNIDILYNALERDYINTFWELFNNQDLHNKISSNSFVNILSNNDYIIYKILIHKKIVDKYDIRIRDFLISFPKSAEILLSTYTSQDQFNNKRLYIPKTLSTEDKQQIISAYLDSDDANLNYVRLIQNTRNQTDFKLSDKIRLKAKRLHESLINKYFSNNKGIRYGVSVTFSKNLDYIKNYFIDETMIINYIYNTDFINQQKDEYSLYLNFKLLFEFLDDQNRISLVSKTSQLGTLEKVIGLRSSNEYRTGTTFSLNNMASIAQLAGYNEIIIESNNSLENIIHHVFTKSFQDLYKFSNNATFAIPSKDSSFFEKIRILAPEFESILKQYKLFAEEGVIDFELLQISSNPFEIKDIPSINNEKYIYINTDNETEINCINILFSNQTLLSYIDPFKDKNYDNFYEILTKEEIKYTYYEEYQTQYLDYLVENNYILINHENIITPTNPIKLIILQDLYQNEFASKHHFSEEFKKEVEEMINEKILYSDNSLLSKPEQAYFNYFLNKKEFTNGLDLRNSYLHGTQARHDEVEKHRNSYLTYLKLLFLLLLKIEDDLYISNMNK